jgi:microcystin-dependent protein
MPFEFINPLMTTGLLQSTNRLSELAGNLSTAYTNLRLDQSLPIGIVMPFAGSTAPSGWALCYGQALSRSTYSGLYGVIGTQYGIGDGSTTFNLPDLRGRVAAGRDNMGGTGASRLSQGVLGGNPGSLGASGGAESLTTTAASLSGSGTNVATSSGNIQPTLILNYIIKTDLVTEAQ